MLQPESIVCRTTLLLSPLQRHFSLILCIALLEVLIALPLRGQAAATAGWLTSVRFLGKMFLVPTGEKGRHNDLLPLAITPEHIVYLQVDEFHTTSKTRSELQFFADMQKHKPAVRVINGAALAPLLMEETLRGKQIAINGFFYQTTGRLWVAEAYVIDK
jgi:hypothetical protein